MSQRPALTNPRADRVRRVAALAGRSARRRSGEFLVEGPQAVREAVRFAAVRSLYLTEDAAARYPEIHQEALSKNIPLYPTSQQVAKTMSRDSQGVLAVAAVPANPDLAAVSEGVQLAAVLVDVRDPGNAGTVIRTADAAGADLVVLAGESVELYNPKVVRATAGSLFHLPVVTGVSTREAVAALRSAGLTIYATAADADDDLTTIASGRRTGWLFGNEAHGLSAEDLALADKCIRIPIRGRAESLNLAAAVAVCLYATVLR